MGEKGQKDSKKAPAELKQSTPLQLKGKVSKNQRASGEKQVHAPRLCYKGHNIVDIMFMPVTGRSRMMYVCECNYQSINTSTPYQTRKDSGVPGKKRDPVKSKGSTNVYLGG